MAKKNKKPKPAPLPEARTVKEPSALDQFEATVKAHAAAARESAPDVSQYLALLGKSGRDRISNYAGTIVSVSFDLFGCVQAILKPGVDKDGKLDPGHYFDVNRIEITDHKRKMPIPNYAPMPAQHDHGPADKPAPRA